MARRRGRAAAALVCVLVVGTGSYVVGDVYDIVPGRLTTQPAPTPPAPFPTAPGAVEPTGAPPPLDPVSTTAPVPTREGLTSSLVPLLADPALGKAVSVSVVDALTGDRLYGHAEATPREPASVVKLLTAASVLHRLGPDATVATRVVQGPSADEVVLVGGGDVLLSAGPGDPQATNGRAGLADLAAATAARLRGEGRTTVALRLDDTLFTGPPLGPGWTASDVRSGFVAPVSAVAVDAGRTTAHIYAPRVADPALSAAETLAELLRAEGVRVVGPVARLVAPTQAEVLGEVRSAAMSEVVGYVLATSDNDAAEALARLVALDAGRPAAFAEASRTVLEDVASLGLDVAGARLVDGSGLGDGAVLPADLVADLLAVAASPDHPQLRPLLTGLPVAGVTGTLSNRFEARPAAAGVVRGKTGSLLGVTTLAGTVVDADGRLLTFAVLADQVPDTRSGRRAVDAVAAALATCGCR